ncbi:Rrp15p-domain-containing protein [Terfezia boudieri ATCC MYA-4762]|uniref:Rrp15p-domain-containing protein n=1 Tax=Terfezia boudieri ATCC MYA-4762 TaxID=1051890 RepID=A0A3N4LUV8_9PEZI|nr:Rrp15p-domain-containing protein [Terfezia boudieri ATCC MYA-4762]
MTDHSTEKRRRTGKTAPAKSTQKAPRPDSPSDAESGSESDAAPPSNEGKKAPAAAHELGLDATSDGNDEYDDVSGSDVDAEDEFLNSDEDSDDSSDSLDSVLAGQRNGATKRRKRNDPNIFATSMSKILSSHLTTKARSDPVLVRSKAKAQVIDESKLETKARRVLREQRRLELEKGRVRDVLPKGDGMEVMRAVERERQLRKTAQRGVVRMFNAVRAAQVKSEVAQAEVKKTGLIGMGNREQKVTEMSKQSFLDLIQSSSAKPA